MPKVIAFNRDMPGLRQKQAFNESGVYGVTFRAEYVRVRDSKELVAIHVCASDGFREGKLAFANENAFVAWLQDQYDCDLNLSLNLAQEVMGGEPVFFGEDTEETLLAAGLKLAVVAS